MKLRKTFSSGLIAAFGLFAICGAAMAAEYAVVVNAANPVLEKGEDARDTVRRVYLKELSAWPGGAESQPFAREAGSPVQTAFVKAVLGMDETAINDHWTRVKQTKGETPPREVGSVNILFRLVGKFEGGLSVVTAEEAASAPAEVKVLFRFSD